MSKKKLDDFNMSSLSGDMKGTPSCRLKKIVFFFFFRYAAFVKY